MIFVLLFAEFVFLPKEQVLGLTSLLLEVQVSSVARNAFNELHLALHLRPFLDRDILTTVKSTHWSLGS